MLIKQEDWNTGAAINYSVEDETAAAIANVTIVGDARRPNNDAFIDVSSTIASESESIADPLGLYGVVTTTTSPTMQACMRLDNPEGKASATRDMNGPRAQSNGRTLLIAQIMILISKTVGRLSLMRSS